MKRLLLLIVVLNAAFLYGYAQNGFKISGKVANMPDGTVWLFGRGGQNKLDTLASSKIKGGVFELTGQVKSGCLALIAMPDNETGFQLMLENADYTLVADEQGNTDIRGGEAQTLFRRFDEINQRIKKKQEEVKKTARKLQSYEQIMSLQNSYDSFVKKAEGEQLDLMRANAQNFVSAYMLAGMMESVSLEILQELYGKFSDDVKNGIYGKMIADQIGRLERIAVGAVAPDFTVMTPEGKPVSLHSIPGKVKLVDFWASWCQPCRMENPKVVKMYEKYHEKGLEIFGVSLDTDKAAWEKAIEQDALPWIHGSELLQVPKVALLYQIKAIPHTILLDENNKIIAKDLRGKELENKIAELLGEK